MENGRFTTPDLICSMGIDQKKHVLIITSWYPTNRSSAGIFVKEQAEALQSSGHRVTILFFKYTSIFQQLKNTLSGKVDEIPLPTTCTTLTSITRSFLPVSLWKNPKERQKKLILEQAAKTLRAYIAQNGQPDLIHHHCLSDFSYITHSLALQFKIPYVFTEHSNYQNLDELAKFNTYETDEDRMTFVKEAALRIAVSRHYKKVYQQIFGIEFTVIPNMVADEFENIPLPSNKKNIPFKFINVAFLHPMKGQDLLVKAFAQSFRGDKAVRLQLVGQNTSPFATEVLELSKQEGIIGQIDFLGIQPRSAVIQLLDDASVFVLSSLRETFCVALAEAMFRGLPVVTTNNGGSEDVFFKEAGMTCQPGSVEELAFAMRKMHESYFTFDSLAISKIARSKFSSERVVQLISEQYEKLVGKK